MAVKVDWMGDIAGLHLEVRSSYCLYKIVLGGLSQFLIDRLVDVKLGLLSLFGNSQPPRLFNLILPELAVQYENIRPVALSCKSRLLAEPVCDSWLRNHLVGLVTFLLILFGSKFKLQRVVT